MLPLVSDADKCQVPGALGSMHGIGEAEIRVTNHPEHVSDPPSHHGLDHDVRHGAFVRQWRFNLDVHAVTAHFDWKTGRPITEARGRFPVERVVVVAVPGAAQPPPLDRSFTEWATLVGTVVVEGSVAAATVSQRQAAMARHHGLYPTFG